MNVNLRCARAYAHGWFTDAIPGLTDIPSY